MKKLSVLCLIFFVFSLAALYAGEWTGYIADAGCAGKDVSKAGGSGHSDCSKRCIGKGAAAVLVADGKVYKLDSQDEAKKFAGEKVMLKGTASDDGSIKVESITKAEN
ncbi:MAG TPA: DUF5818 domain-containing protein [Acidobacteriota bacterium]|jgi:hypothetical protein